MKISTIRTLAKRFPIPDTKEEQEKILQILRSEGIDMQNLYQELEMSAPMAETHRDTSYSNAQISLHSHTFYEMLYCRQCEGVEYLVGAERYRLREGDIVIVAPGISHRPLLPDTMAAPYSRDIVWFSEAFVDLLPQQVADVRMDYPESEVIFLRTKDTKWEFLGQLFREGVLEAERDRMGSGAIVLGNTIQLLGHIAMALEETGVAHPKAETPELLDKVMAYIEAHLSEKITLEDTAKQFYVSASTISQLFRKKMGTSFYRCITQRRLIAAKTRIGQGEGLESVGRAVGFADYSSFYRAFKKEYGISPRQFTRL